MKWARPKPRGTMLCDVIGPSGDGAFGDFNASLSESKKSDLVECESVPECIEDLQDVADSQKRLADLNETTVTADELRKQLGL